MANVYLYSGRNHCKAAWIFYTMVVIIALSFFTSVQISDVNGQTKWIKHPKNPVLDITPGGWDALLVGYHYVLFDGNEFKMWYAGLDNNWHERIGLATSPDGINWTKYPTPVLDLVGQGQWEGDDVYAPSVLYDGTTYQMWYNAFGGPSPGGICYAVSTDGINWTRHPANPILKAGPSGSWDADGPWSSYVIFDGKTYKMWYEGANAQGHNIGYVTSPDGISWTKHPNNPVLKVGPPGSFDDDWLQTPCVVFDGVNYHMWYSGATKTTEDIGYATSADGIKWTKDSNNPVLVGDNAVNWEKAAVWTPRVIFDGKKYRMWYSGVESGITFRIGYANTPLPHDLRFAALPTSLERLPILANIEPTTEILNGGLNDEFNVKVNCQVDSQGIRVYSNTLTIDTLTSLATRLAAFDNWRPYTANNFMLSFYTQLANDDDLSNDTLRTTIETSNLMDDFENGITSWQSNGKWTTSMNSAHSGKYSLKNSPGNYDNNVDSQIEYQYSFDLSRLSAAHISYWTKYSIEADHDFGYVEASADSGRTWQQLGDRYTGSQSAWKEDSRSLTGLCGPGFNDVRIRFHFVSNPSTVRQGWYIDDVNIYPYEVPTAVTTEENKPLPEQFVLYDNYPNPFNAQTAIEYQLPQAGHVKLVVYNLLGQEIKTLIIKNQEAGRYNLVWDGKDNLGQAAPSGVYFYRIQAEGFTETKKMLLLQ